MDFRSFHFAREFKLALTCLRVRACVRAWRGRNGEGEGGEGNSYTEHKTMALILQMLLDECSSWYLHNACHNITYNIIQ